MVTQDVLPFSHHVSKREIKVFGANSIGLERRGFATAAIEALQTAFRLLTARQAEHHAGHRADPRGSAAVRRRWRNCSSSSAPRERGVVKYDAVRTDRRQRAVPGAGARERAAARATRSWSIAIKEEASPEVEPLAARCHWISLGQLGKLIDICKQEGITEVMMCGQVKHAKIFSPSCRTGAWSSCWPRCPPRTPTG